MFERLSFTARIFLASAVLVALALGVSALATYSRGYVIARNAANDGLSHSRAEQQSFQKLRFQQLKLMSQLLATDPAFLSYVTEAGGSSLTGSGTVDVRSIADLLTERQAEIGFDFGMVLDPSGALLARSGNASAPRESMASDPVVALAMQSQAPEAGYWFREGHAYQVAVAPLANRDELGGYLVLGLGVDQSFLQDVKRVSGAELVLLDSSGGRFTNVSSTLDQQQLDSLSQALSGMHELPTGVFDLSLGGEHWLAYADPLGGGDALTLISFDKAMGGFRSILFDQILAALIATFLAVSLSWWLSRRITQPLKELAVAAQSAARGDFQQRFTAQGGGEIAQLTEAFDSLLADLREKSEIENYMADLAKYQPDATAEHTPGFGGLATSPESLNGAFLGVRMHDTLDANLVMPDKALMAFNQLLRNLEVPARIHGGRLAAVAGNTIFLVFDNAEAALYAAGQTLQAAAAQGQRLSMAAALGQIITGAVDWTGGGAASLLGVPVRQLEELLPDAMPGVLLATSEFAKAAETVSGVKASDLTGTVSGRGLTRLEPPLPQLAAGAGEGETQLGTQPIVDSGVLKMRTGLSPGMVLGGRYEILSELGAGGMAVVYKARDRQLNEVVALKTIKSEDSQDERLLDAMKSEIRLARKITHRNVLRIYDFGDAGGVPFISMEYVRGMTLRYLLQNRSRVPYAAGLRIMRQVCTALQVAHEQSVLHRDIKPENVMLEPSGNAKLMDFGIASLVHRGEGEAERMLVGTPRYASPEQLRGDPVDERTDVYACGAMMYQMFTGKLPFNERSVDRLLEAKTKQEYVRPSDHVPGFPPELEKLIDSCLRADREQRPKSAEALLKILERMRV
ncbi:MAG: protein kinase domain-containing protein [Bacillota bacterium]